MDNTIGNSTAAISNLGDAAVQLVRAEDGTYRFSASAAEITILDGRGRMIWRTEHADPSGFTTWNGIDMMGDAVPVGSYTCKLRYKDSTVVYVPFVFMR